MIFLKVKTSRKKKTRLAENFFYGMDVKPENIMQISAHFRETLFECLSSKSRNSFEYSPFADRNITGLNFIRYKRDCNIFLIFNIKTGS